MDIISHAIAGAATGLPFNRPLIGALIAVAPDFVLGAKRRLLPSPMYNLTHSLPFLACMSLTAGAMYGPIAGVFVASCLASHLVLDLSTHGERWAPTLFYPIVSKRYSFGNEWEFFNASWWAGLLSTSLWSAGCIALSLLDIGPRLLRFAQ